MTRDELFKAIDDTLGLTIQSSAQIQANYDHHGLVVERPVGNYAKKKG